MLRSLRRHDPLAAIYLLALDERCADVVRDLWGRDVLTLATLHAEIPELRAG